MKLGIPSESQILEPNNVKMGNPSTSQIPEPNNVKKTKARLKLTTRAKCSGNVKAKY